MTNKRSKLNLKHKLQGMTTAIIFSVFSVWMTQPLTAGEADVVNVTIKKVGSIKFRIDATLAHADTGWDHYANKWDVLDQDGNLLGTRVLHHPHVEEQPFTRSLTLEIPKNITTVVIRAGDSVHEDGGKEMTIDVPH